MPQPIDARELAQLLDEHAARLEWYASTWTHTPADCVQEAFIALARSLQGPGSPIPWLYRTVRNNALNAARSQRRRTHHETLAAWPEKKSLSDSLSEADRLSHPEALASLTTDHREIVVLRIWSELTWQEIAELVGTSSSSAQRTYVSALEKLKHQLEPPCPAPIPCRLR